MSAPIIVVSNAYLPGYCEPGTKDLKTGKIAVPKDCVITREAFERLFDAVPKPGGHMTSLDAPAAMRRSIATTYATMIGWSKEAERRGLEKSPVVQEQLRLAKVQILERALKDELQNANANPSDAAIEAYYKDNAGAYTELSLERVLMPQTGDPDPANPTAERIKMTYEEAAKFQARAVAGESPQTLQAEVWKRLFKKGDPPLTSATRRHNSMRPEVEAVVFSLPAGQVSPVLTEGLSYVFYKVVARKILPLDEVRDDIRRTLAAQATQDAESKVNQDFHFQLGEIYFQTTTKKPDPEPALNLPTPRP